MSESELSSFVSKFLQLKKAGATAHLDVDTRAGEAWVRLSVQLDQGSVKKPRKRSPCYYRRQERRKAAAAEAAAGSHDVPRAPAGEATARGEDVPDAPAAEAEVRDEVVPAAAAEEAVVSESRVIVSSECRKIVPSIVKEDVSVIECVIIETLTSIAEIDNHRVKCRHCGSWSTVNTFHIHDCSRSRSDEEFVHVPHKFYLDVKAIADQDPDEIAAICGL